MAQGHAWRRERDDFCICIDCRHLGPCGMDVDAALLCGARRFMWCRAQLPSGVGPFSEGRKRPAGGAAGIGQARLALALAVTRHTREITWGGLQSCAWRTVETRTLRVLFWRHCSRTQALPSRLLPGAQRPTSALVPYVWPCPMRALAYSAAEFSSSRRHVPQRRDTWPAPYETLPRAPKRRAHMPRNPFGQFPHTARSGTRLHEHGRCPGRHAHQPGACVRAARRQPLVSQRRQLGVQLRVAGCTRRRRYEGRAEERASREERRT